MNDRRSNIKESVRKELEFDKVISLLKDFAKSDSNKERISSLSILHNLKVLDFHLDCLEEFQYVYSDTKFPRYEYIDLSEVIKYLEIQNAVLVEEQLFKIYDATNWVNDLIYFINHNDYEIPKIRLLLGDLKKSLTIKNRIEKVFTPKRFIRSSASKNLKLIRQEISKKRAKVAKYFQESLSHYVHLGFLDNIKESYADGAALLAVSSEHKRKVKGQVRGQSKTKSITFIEPDKCININQELSHLYNEEKEELRRILKELTADIALSIDRVLATKRLMEEIDFLSAKLQLAQLMNASRPNISKSKEITINQAYHPLLLIENNKRKLETIPQDIFFDDKHRVVVISGPNAGGKSITLKTFGLNQLMLQVGLFIPVHPNSSLRIFHDIYTDIGDNQSIENELSTYSYRLNRMKQILSDASKSSFILIDEFGSGSDPVLGGELAAVFFKEIVRSGAYGVLTTHYGNIKLLAEQTDDAENACMLFDDEQLNPLYKLKVGQPGSSYTFEVAKNVGLPSKLIDEAKSKLKNGTLRFEDTIHHYQRLSRDLQLAKDELKKQDDSVRAQKEDYDKKLESLQQKIESQRFIMEFESKYLQLGKKVNKFIELYRDGNSMKSIVSRFKKIIEKESNRKEENSKDPKAEQKLKKRAKANFNLGQEVRIEGTNQQGEILELKSNSALLQIGFAKMEVKLEKLEPVNI